MPMTTERIFNRIAELWSGVWELKNMACRVRQEWRVRQGVSPLKIFLNNGVLYWYFSLICTRNN